MVLMNINQYFCYGLFLSSVSLETNFSTSVCIKLYILSVVMNMKYWTVVQENKNVRATTRCSLEFKSTKLIFIDAPFSKIF